MSGWLSKETTGLSVWVTSVHQEGSEGANEGIHLGIRWLTNSSLKIKTVFLTVQIQIL